MTKALKYILLCTILVGSPLGLMAEELCDGPESELSLVTLTVNGRIARICGANGETLNVYNLTGVKIASFRIDSSDKTVDTNLSHGCYIFKVGNIVRKVSIR